MLLPVGHFPYRGQDTAQSVLLLGQDVCRHPFLDELEGPFVLIDLGQFMALHS